MARETVAHHHRDIVVAERLQARARGLGERAIALDAHDLAREPREYGSLIARAGADLEHAVVRRDRELLAHIGDHVRLADGLPAVDRQRLVGIGGVGMVWRDAILARDLAHGAQPPLVDDAAPPQVEQEPHAYFALVALHRARRLLRRGRRPLADDGRCAADRGLASAPPAPFGHGYPNSCASRVMNGSSVRSSLSAVTAMRPAAIAERSVPSAGAARSRRI